MKIRIHWLADREMVEAALWYDERRPGLGDAFLNSFQAAVLFSAEFPLTGSLVVGEVRRRNGRRRPKYWAKRRMQ
jgi:hypothetical protein